jgi:putative DNA primase/helicase
MTEGKDEEERRKRITAKLLEGPQFILIDNIRAGLDSAGLSAALTSDIWEDRVLRFSQMAVLPVTCTWLATANNPTLSLEVARRTIPIRLDPRMERPWQRTNFKHPNLRRWAREHRGELISAALTLIQAWIVAGQPPGDTSLGGYESWAEVMGGVLQLCGIPGFLGNMDQLYAQADRESIAWAEFCLAWWEEFQDRPVSTEQLLGIATRERLLLDIWVGRVDHSGRIRFGRALSKMRGRVLGDFRIEQAGTDSHNKTPRYSLADLRGVRGVAGSVGHQNFSPPGRSSQLNGDSQNGSSGAEKFDTENTPQYPATPRSQSRMPYKEML